MLPSVRSQRVRYGLVTEQPQRLAERRKSEAVVLRRRLERVHIMIEVIACPSLPEKLSADCGSRGALGMEG